MSAEDQQKLTNEEVSMPKKRFFRSRAHCNPLSHNDSFLYPINPQAMDWTSLYPEIPTDQRIVRILDMGMGFGGLTVSLAELFPDKLVLGMEIRAKVMPRLFLETFPPLPLFRFANMCDWE